MSGYTWNRMYLNVHCVAEDVVQIPGLQAVAAGLLDGHIACPMPVTIGWEMLV